MKKSLWVCISFLLFFFLASFLCVGNVMAYQPFPDTGQTKCYDDEQEIDCPAPGEPFYGQDAQYQPRLPRSYTKLGHGGVELSSDAAHIDDGGEWIMTRDNVTGLIWEIKTKENKYNRYEYYDALDIFLKNLNENEFGGYSDWRLPNIKELSSLVKSENYSPAIGKEWFPNAQICSYWSSSIRSRFPNALWTASFKNKYITSEKKHNEFYARAVLSEKPCNKSFIDNGDGTVTDPNTGLMWQKEIAPEKYNWEEALDYAEELTLAEHSDWRIPNRNELQTLVDYSRRSIAIDPIFHENAKSGRHWSSTTGNDPQKAFHITFYSGRLGTRYKSAGRHFKMYVRAVRTDDAGPIDNYCDPATDLIDDYYQPERLISYTKMDYGGYELDDDAAHIDDGGEWIMTRDNVTGLIWEIKTKENKYNRYEYYDALDIFLKNLNENEFGGYSDWRLPNIKELSSLVKSENYSPAIDKEWFPNARPSIYWSSTEHAQKPNSAWYVYFSEGHVLDTITSNSFYARAVRGEQSSPEPLIDNKDGTFTDPNTGLMWEKNPRARRFTWQDSLYYAENLRYAGYSDWRLPSRHELQTLVDYSQHNPAIDPLFPGESFTAGYWSSSIHTKGTSLAWYVSLGFGIILNDNMEDRYFRRAVRVIEKDPTDKDIDVEVPEDKDKDDGSSSSSSGCVVGTLF